MMRDSKLSRRKSGKNLNFEEAENVPVNVNLRESSIRRMSIDSCSRPPLNTIPNPSKPAQESGFKSSKTHTTPTKAKIRHQESAMTMRTPEKQGVLARDRFGWGHDAAVNTPRSCRTLGRASLGVSELHSTHTTPTKSVTKPPNPGLIYGGNSRPPVRIGNFAALSKGIPVTSNTCTTVNTVEAPHFDLREDPSFWMDHNVQVLIRIRPLNGMEISSQGYNRCLKQENAQCLTWVGNPESRFTFDHVACETIDQETLFKMVGQPMVENCLSGYNSCMFAYGQTGSGKTHTMLGEINNLEVKPSPYRGMTPRIFEFLFSRILVEEGSRKNERLTYNCKCSFLEIYNEQITDLLDPSSTNLQLREDVKKGVYVENLTEFEVHTVGDILRLLSQGSANRRVASTNMNRESSRSHSVFTCVIESRWEKDSTSNLRFARLNLVDLAGSERQKSSGAEGERLKEAANINKSLSTLGHVIMVLVDGANARTRHVPYRDSRLTFLLQDSLGGNSKTMIIANVSPSVSSATETLNTLKFAQRAKLIQNNAVINEDASGDVEALQHQIRLLKEELATLKRLNISRSLKYNSKNENCSNASSLDTYEDDEKVLRVSCKQLKSLETSLNGALRREQTTENSIKQLEAEMEQLNSLVRQREEENRCTKMMLKFREEKIQRMECLLAGSLTVDSYLLEENNMVNEELKILRAKVDRNPEVTRFAVENIRLLEQLRRFQDFYEEGEREMLLTEVSELRDQLVLFLNENSKKDDCMNQSIEMEGTKDKKEDDFLQLELKKSQEELEKCRDNLNSCLEKNAKLCREISELNALLEMQKSALHVHEHEPEPEQDGGIEVIKEPILEAPTIDDHSAHTVDNKDDILAKNTTEVLDLQLEVEILKIILKEERLTCGETEEKALCSSKDLKLTEEKLMLITKQCENLKDELQEAKSVIEALEIQNLMSINELEDLKNSNNQYAEILREKELEITSLDDKILSQISQDQTSSSNHLEKLNTVQDSLEKAKRLNTLYQNDQACHASNEEQMDEVRKQVEAETTEVIVCLQEELCNFQQKMHESSLKERDTQQELTILQEKLDVMTECNRTLKEDSQQLLGMYKEKLDIMTECNKTLKEKCEEKDKKIYGLSEEIEEVLSVGRMALDDVLNQFVPGKRESVSEKLQIIARNISEKELRIVELNSCLEDAKSKGNEMESMLRSLRGATLVMSEAHQQDCNKKDQEIIHLSERNRSLLEALNQKEGEIDKLKESLTEKDFVIEDAEKQILSLKVESCCYLDKFVEIDFMINKMVTENEAMKIEITELKKKAERYSIYEEQLNSDTMKMKGEVEEIESMILEIKAIVDEDLVPMASDFRSLLEALNQKEGEIDKLKESLTEKDFVIEDAEKQILSLKVESCCYLDKFVEIDFMINKMVTENEAMKIEITELKKKAERYSIYEEQLNSDTMKMKGEVEEIESMILEIKAIVDEDLVPMASDFCETKSCFHDLLTWHEEIWCEIIAKDWAVSVLHVCHMGILMETVTAMNVEKGLLYHGLCESNSFVSQLKEQNGKSRKELEACSMLRGKLLVDIKNSFDRISRKEEETGKLSIKITSFEKKILELQVMEEMMLERFNRMGHEFFILMKELDDSHQNQQVVNDKDEELRLLEEKLVIDSSAKEMELFIMLSKLEQMDSINNDLEKEKSSMSMVLEKFKEDMIISYVDTQLKDLILVEKDAKIDLLKKEVEMQEEDVMISFKHELEMKVAELRLQKVENETLAVMLKDQKHEMEEFEASFEDLDCELYENVVKSHVFEAQLKEKVALISTLEADFSRKCESVKSLSSQIQLLTEKDEDALKTKERLEMEVVELGTVLNEKNILLESLKKNFKTVSCEKDDISGKLLGAMKEVENAQAIVEEKEEELKVYEKSVEELECTVSVLENQVEMVKGDAERQRLQREELELEIHNLKQQILSVKSSDSDMQRDLDEKEKEVQDLLRRNIILEKEITELNLQAREHNQTFKAMETPPDHDVSSPYNLNSPLKRSGSRSRSRGPASPFKCIRLGFDEDLISARIRIQELEALLASRQKEIYMLNKKLGMTHDVLGKKSDTTNYSSIDELHEKTRIHNADSQDEKQELIKLKQQLNDFVVERQRSREEIERLQVALDQIHQQEHLLKTENEMFKTEIDNLKKDMMELEAAGQQNLQQQIHHHAKMKAENDVLKALNDKITHKLKRAESLTNLGKGEVRLIRQVAGARR